VLFAGIFVVAFATLLFELSLIRVLSFTIWHHFGYVVISTALLGFGASGTFLAVRPAFGVEDLRATLVDCAWLSGAAVACLLGFVSLAPLHPMSILESPAQAALLVAYQVVAALPFFFSGLLVSLSLRIGAERVDRLYFCDLIGAGLGCICAVGLMNLLTPPGAALVAAAAFAAAGAVYAETGKTRLVSLGLLALFGIGSGFSDAVQFTPARSKEYSRQLALFDFEPYFTRWTALFRTDVLEDVNRTLVGRNLWGISKAAPPDTARPRFYISHDATAGAGIYDLRESHELDYLEYHILRFPYLVANPEPRVLVIGVGGGRDLITAMQSGASQVTGVELDPVAIELIRDRMNEIGDGFFRRPEIRLVAGEGRHFVKSSGQKFDVIQLTGVDTLSAMNSGAYVLAENYLYTVEAFHDYLDHLNPGGILSFAMGNADSDEPRAAGRIVSVAQRALRERGITRPERYIAAIGSRNLYAEVMIRTTPYQPRHTRTLAAEARRLKFERLLLPHGRGHPVFEGLAATTGPARADLLRGLRFNVAASTDDNPFFLSFFRWSGLFEPGRLTPSHASALGQIVLGLLLLILTALGTVFILGPLFVFQRRAMRGKAAERIGVMLYFVSLGLAFMLFEISLIQRFLLFLGYPTYSLSITLSSLLVFLGCGSFLSRRWVGRERVALPLGVLTIAALALFYVAGLPPLQEVFFGSPLWVRGLVTAAVLAPLGLAMGIFFPIGIRIAHGIHEDLVPWAWGINGCASVTAGVLAMVLAMSFGFTAVWVVSVLVYALGTAALLATAQRG
jgi:spermidine synthase